MAQAGWSQTNPASVCSEGWAAGPSANTRGRSKIGRLPSPTSCQLPLLKGTGPLPLRQALGILQDLAQVSGLLSQGHLILHPQLVRMGSIWGVGR